MNQYIEIKLGSPADISQLAATYSPSDRPVIGPFTAEVSIDGAVFQPFGAGYTNTVGPNVATDAISASTPVKAQYILFNLGPTGSQYNYGGSAVREVFAYGVPAAAPEPSLWALMSAGVAAVGAAARAHRGHMGRRIPA